MCNIFRSESDEPYSSTPLSHSRQCPHPTSTRRRQLTISLPRLELVIWLVPSLVGGAIAIAFIGVFLGPIYPLVMNHTARILPHWLLTGSIGWIAGLGQAGSAFIPFITGVIASREGISALQPVYVVPLLPIVFFFLLKTKLTVCRMVAMMAVMFGLWLLVPSSPRRID